MLTVTLEEVVTSYARAVALIDFALARISHGDFTRASDDLRAAREELDVSVTYLGAKG